MEINPDNSILWYLLGYTQEGPEAIRCLKKALEINPKYINAWILLGDIYRDNNDSQEANRCYKKILEIDSTNYLAERELINCNL